MPRTKTATPKAVRTAKAIANLKLTGALNDDITLDIPRNGHPQPTDPQPGTSAEPGMQNPGNNAAAGDALNNMEGADANPSRGATPADGNTPGGSGQNPMPTPDPMLVSLHTMMKDFTESMKERRSKSRSRSTSSRRSRPRRRSTPERGYTPSSTRSRSRRSRSRSRSPRSRAGRSTSRRRSGTRRTTRSRSRDRRSPARRRSNRDRSPRAVRSDPDARREADKALDAQYPPLGNPSGKKLPVRGLPLEPYRSLPPDLRKLAKERYSRRDLSFPEYTCGFLKMVATALEPTSEAHAALTHAANVAQDAATLPWPAVREWTQACLVHIEDKNATWHDNDLFVNDRTRLSWIKGRQLMADNVYPCPKFNTGKCDQKATHSAQGDTWVHACAICLYMTGTEKGSHNASNCRQKTSRQHDENRYDNKQKAGFNKPRRERQDPKPKN